jgi:tetratricopeptide (TPR) repeat protein
MLFGQAGDYDRALDFFHHAVELDPESPEINYDTGLTLYWKKDYSAARKFIAAALAERPDFFEALATQGAILYLMNDDSAARKVLERAHELRPDDSAVSQLLAQLRTPPAN